MALPRAMATHTSLSPAEIAEIPSPRLPISLQLSHLIHEFSSLSIQLFSILSSPSSTSQFVSALTDPIYASLAAVDSKLSKLVSLAAEHQQRQARIDALVASLETLSSSYHASTTTLASCVELLDPVVAAGKLDRVAIGRARAASATPASSSAALLSYARLLAPFTSAPPSSLYPPNEKLRTKALGATDPTGRTLPPGAIPPFPTEGVMRRGRLQFGRDALGQTGETGPRREGQELHPTELSHGDATAIERLQFEAKQYETLQQHQHSGSHNFTTTTTATDGQGGGAEGADDDADDDEPEEEQFEFDLDLNPDL